ncbi:MAG: response regulator transcription factor [Bacteroidota bacterium]
MIQVAIVEDDIDIRENLAMLIDSEPKYSCTQRFHKVEEAIPGLRLNPPDVLLMDISLPGMRGIEGVGIIKTENPGIEVVMLTVHQEDGLVFESLCAGASGYLTKNTSPDDIMVAIQEAYEGGAPMSTNIARMVVNSFKRNPGPDLSVREREVLSELCKGKSYKMVADSLFISQDTVRTHIRNIYRKLEVNSKSEAVAKALKEHLV